jgi:molybdate transport system ATP-binding protein
MAEAETMKAGRQGSALQIAVAQRFSTGFAIDATLDAELESGAVLVLFGPSGAGKTTILRQIAGLDRPDAGTIQFGGEVWCDIAAGVFRPPQERRIGLVFQEPTLFPHLTVEKNTSYGLTAPRVRPGSDLGPGSAREKAVEVRPGSDLVLTSDLGGIPVAEIAMMLGIGDLGNRYPRSLSGGEAQRVALARALAPGPRLLLLDEPFAALDAPTRARLRRDLRALLQTLGTPAILITHDRGEALAMGDSVAVVIGGRVRQSGPVSDVFSRPADAEVAASLGVESVLPARIVGSADGLIEVAVGTVVLHVAEREAMTPGGAVYVCIRAEDVTLETRAPGQASTRNHLAARIVAIVSEGPIERVTLDCGFTIDALITRRSREELMLAPGATATAAIKATSIHLISRS